MKEFDFDELDRAVNTLMGDVKQPSDTSPAETVISLPEQSKPVAGTSTEPKPGLVPSSPIVVEDTPALPAAMLPTRPSSPILPPRHGGRFMDVVRASSDMKSPVPPSPVLAATREGTTLQPLSEGARPSSSPRPVIDVMAPMTPPSERSPEIPVANDSLVPGGEASEAKPTETLSPSEPWSSPFLPDTQVEKRPLGGSQLPTSENGLSEAIAAELSKETPPEETTPSPSQPADEPATLVEPAPKESEEEPVVEPSTEPSTPGSDLQLTPETEPTVMPAELDNDLVAIESGQKSLSVEEPASKQTPISPPVISTSSISQQYDEQPSSGDASHTPIYDNEAVHQPLAHPAKKKKSWVLIVFIVIILALGGGLGAAAYFLGLI